MAKEKKTKVEVEESQMKETVVMEKPVVKKEPQKPKWEIKDRTYILKDGKRPLSKSIRATDIYWFDEKAGYERELKYCENQKTSFVDEMKGDQRLAHIVFRNGILHVKKSKVVLQKLLSLYHPHRNKIYFELKPQVIAENQIDNIEIEIEALTSARDLDIDTTEAVMRVELGSKVSNMSSKELRRDLLLFARNNPRLF